MSEVALSENAKDRDEANDIGVAQHNETWAREFALSDGMEEGGSKRWVVVKAPSKGSLSDRTANGWERAAHQSARDGGPRRIIALTGHGTPGPGMDGVTSNSGEMPSAELGSDLKVDRAFFQKLNAWRTDREGTDFGAAETARFEAYERIKAAVERHGVEEIVLAVCRTAKERAGKKLVQQISDDLGVKVTAPKMLVGTRKDESGKMVMTFQRDDQRNTSATVGSETPGLVPNEGEREYWFTATPDSQKE